MKRKMLINHLNLDISRRQKKSYQMILIGESALLVPFSIPRAALHVPDAGKRVAAL